MNYTVKDVDKAYEQGLTEGMSLAYAIICDYIEMRESLKHDTSELSAPKKLIGQALHDGLSTYWDVSDLWSAEQRYQRDKHFAKFREWQAMGFFG